MKKLIPTALAFLLLTACGTKKETKDEEAKTVTTDSMTDEMTTPISSIENGHLMGIHDEEAFNQDPFASWFQPGYVAYEPDAVVIDELTNHLQDVEIRIYMGTWCGDSKRETPKFYKLLDQAEFDQSKLTLVAVDPSKTEPESLINGYNIMRVPTFIFYRNGKELGRFVERPVESLEQDILKIVSEQGYKHAYED